MPTRPRPARSSRHRGAVRRRPGEHHRRLRAGARAGRRRHRAGRAPLGRRAAGGHPRLHARAHHRRRRAGERRTASASSSGWTRAAGGTGASRASASRRSRRSWSASGTATRFWIELKGGSALYPGHRGARGLDGRDLRRGRPGAGAVVRSAASAGCAALNRDIRVGALVAQAPARPGPARTGGAQRDLPGDRRSARRRCSARSGGRGGTATSGRSTSRPRWTGSSSGA